MFTVEVQVFHRCYPDLPFVAVEHLVQAPRRPSSRTSDDRSVQVVRPGSLGRQGYVERDTADSLWMQASKAREAGEGRVGEERDVVFGERGARMKCLESSHMSHVVHYSKENK